MFEPHAHSPVTEASEDAMIVAAMLEELLNKIVPPKWPGVRR